MINWRSFNQMIFPTIEEVVPQGLNLSDLDHQVSCARLPGQHFGYQTTVVRKGDSNLIVTQVHAYVPYILVCAFAVFGIAALFSGALFAVVYLLFVPVFLFLPGAAARAKHELVAHQLGVR